MTAKITEIIYSGDFEVTYRVKGDTLPNGKPSTGMLRDCYVRVVFDPFHEKCASISCHRPVGNSHKVSVETFQYSNWYIFPEFSLVFSDNGISVVILPVALWQVSDTEFLMIEHYGGKCSQRRFDYRGITLDFTSFPTAFLDWRMDEYNLLYKLIFASRKITG